MSGFSLRGCSTFILFIVLSRTAFPSGGRLAPCPPIKLGAEVQKQFQLLQHTHHWISPEHEKELDRIFSANEPLIKQKSCNDFVISGTTALNENLMLIQLHILQLRWNAYKSNENEMKKSFTLLRDRTHRLLQQPSLLERRLGASVRSLYLDELERLMDLRPHFVKSEIRRGPWNTDFSAALLSEVKGEWRLLREKLPAKKTSKTLVLHFGQRPWRHSKFYQSKLGALLSRMRMSPEETLESQLQVLFQSNKNNFHLEESERVVDYYLHSAVDQIRQNNYFILKPWLEPLIESKVQVLKTELGASWPLVAPLVGVTLEGPFREFSEPIELLESSRLEQARTHYASVFNPMGRLYEVVFLKRMTQLWTQIDVSQLKADLNRVSFLNTLIAVRDYQKKFAEWPKSIENLVQRELLDRWPNDFFTGKPLRYDPVRRQIWSVGENGIDENGRGDDIALRLAL